MGSWQDTKERWFWVHGSGRLLCPWNSLLQKHEERVSVKPNQKKTIFQSEKLGVAKAWLPKTSLKMAGLLAQVICHPVKNIVIAPNAIVWFISSPFRMFKFISLHHTLQDIHTPCHPEKRRNPQIQQRIAGEGSLRKTTLRGSQSECTLLTSSVTHPEDEKEGAPRWIQQPSSPRHRLSGWPHAERPVHL